MDGKYLYEFYEKVLLPQFGCMPKQEKIAWAYSQTIGFNESVHYFSIGSMDYALIFEDYGGLATSTAWVREKVQTEDFEYVEPVSYSESFEHAYSIKFPMPYKYCANVTGTFTLVRLKG